MLVGYMRVSSDSDRQSTDLQRDALLAAGVDPRHLFEDRASGAKDDRAGLARALEFVRAGDVLVVWKLDRLGRSLSHLLAIVTSLKDKRVAFRSLTENLDTTTPRAMSFSEDDCTNQRDMKPAVHTAPDSPISGLLCTKLVYAQYSCAPKRGEHGDRYRTDCRARRSHPVRTGMGACSLPRGDHWAVGAVGDGRA
uniref:recombinase family protein n=1 Tax=Pseudomonas aeruginosa TaxID=287 RepID=UPI001F3B7F8E|nr:recombinase family protein [Pseudomonas aeruginosa]